MIAYQTAYLKAYYPNEFFSASMTMDISNQNKLSEFYEEIKRLNINIVRPDINDCFSDFRSNNDNFYYALGAVKNVGYEAVSNIVKERIKKGKFKSINDFIKRVNPKDINKLQLEGLVKAGAFDSLNNNRKSIFVSVPNLITKSKNIFDNNTINQIDLFEEKELKDTDIITFSKDWEFEERLSKEFEAVGFFISDHPLNQFKDTFNDYNIIDFDIFNKDIDLEESNIAATLLKVQEKKTQKGNSYAILKLTDLSSVFELFIFSDILELNRDIIKEGNSLMITIQKNFSDTSNRFKRINIKKIVSFKNLINKPISEIEFITDDYDKIREINKIIKNDGNTEVKIKIKEKNKDLVFLLKNKRFVDRKSINILKNQDILANIK